MKELCIEDLADILEKHKGKIDVRCRRSVRLEVYTRRLSGGRTSAEVTPRRGTVWTSFVKRSVITSRYRKLTAARTSSTRMSIKTDSR